MHLRAFPGNDEMLRLQAAELLVEAFPHENGWPKLDLALEEVDEALAPERRPMRTAGCLAGSVRRPDIEAESGKLHPLVVRATVRGRGIGRALANDLERNLMAERALTLWVGPDDDKGETSLAGVELYPAPLDHLRELRAPATHPIGFYLRIGFALCGLMPDANGRGLPGVLLARRLG